MQPPLIIIIIIIIIIINNDDDDSQVRLLRKVVLQLLQLNKFKSVLVVHMSTAVIYFKD